MRKRSHLPLKGKCLAHGTKKDRAIEIGWCNWDNKDQRYKFVRQSRLGGTRSLRLAKDSKKSDIINVGKALFFENGKSPYGDTLDFVFDLSLDVKGQSILPDGEKMDETCKRTLIKKSRYYLLSRKVFDDSDTDIDDTQAPTPNVTQSSTLNATHEQPKTARKKLNFTSSPVYATSENMTPIVSSGMATKESATSATP